MRESVPDVVIQRLPMYAHILRALEEVGVESIGSVMVTTGSLTSEATTRSVA